MALYGVPILFILLLLFTSLLVNYHFGTNIMVLLVLILITLVRAFSVGAVLWCSSGGMAGRRGHSTHAPMHTNGRCQGQAADGLPVAPPTLLLS
jgi:hypothetical protein